MASHSHSLHNKVTAAGLLVTLGIIFGDIGTSPLYVMKAIVGEGKVIDPQVVIGGVSAVFWTLMLQTTIKYVIITLRADNKGEGGIFALYALVKRLKIKWLFIPAVIGGAALLADGIITPPISVASAIEGLRVVNENIETLPIIFLIITFLFGIQAFGTKMVGKFFGPIMLLWFLMLGAMGAANLHHGFSILNAFNPYYAIHLLAVHPQGLLVMGAVFLCTTGAEALYSDLGHCGRANIRASWIFVKIMLVLNYFGQGAWLIAHSGEKLEGNPFFSIIPAWFLPFSIVIATLAAIVASQALISGSFTLINEAIRLDFWPKLRIIYPTETRGQLYIPKVNLFLWIGCMGVVYYFKESTNMEAAYGLSIVLTMLMTTVLLAYFLRSRRVNPFLILSIVLVYFTIEIFFLFANLSKFFDGGFITLMIASLLVSVMLVWYLSKGIRQRYVEFVSLNKYLDRVKKLSTDERIPKYANHLVFMTNSGKADEVESKFMYSILMQRPKRADFYWFVHVHVMDQPYGMDYKVEVLAPQDVIRLDFFIGFREAPRVTAMVQKVAKEMVESNEIQIDVEYQIEDNGTCVGDFRFIVMEKFLSYSNELPWYEKIILDLYYLLKRVSLAEDKAFGLDPNLVTVEKVPVMLSENRLVNLRRVKSRPH